MFGITRSDLVKVLDHAATWWRHWYAQELQQFNITGPVVRIGTRSFQIHHERSNDADKMFPRPGLNTYLLVEERLRSRSWNNLWNRGAATDAQFGAAVEHHIANQKGWLRFVKFEAAAENVKSVLEHTDIYRLYHVWVAGPGMPSAAGHSAPDS